MIQIFGYGPVPRTRRNPVPDQIRSEQKLVKMCTGTIIDINGFSILVYRFLRTVQYCFCG